MCQQQRETVDKLKDLLQAHKVEVVHEDKLGLKRLAYPIQRHATGIYHLFEFKATPDVVATLEVAYKREDRILQTNPNRAKHNLEHTFDKRTCRRRWC